MEVPAYGMNDLKKIAAKEPLTQISKKEVKFREVQTFCQEVQLLVHTVNNNEKWAVLNLFKPPELYPSKLIAEKPLDLYEPNWIVLGMFGGYKSALIQTEQGTDSRKELEDALDNFPKAKLVLAIGVAYANNPDKVKYGDVLVSKFIDGVGNIKYTEDNLIIFRASSNRFMSVSRSVRNVFARGEETWYARGGFKCTKDGDSSGRESRVHSGVIISNKALVNNREVRDNMKKNSPEALGGEMEGVVWSEIKQSAPSRDLGIIVIKGASDYADGTKGKEWQLTAAMAAASYAEHKLKSTDGKLFIEGTLSKIIYSKPDILLCSKYVELGLARISGIFTTLARM